MAPWYVMPRGEAATRAAALDPLRNAVDALRCAATLIATGRGTPGDRQLAVAMLAHLGRLETALDRLERGGAARN